MKNNCKLFLLMLVGAVLLSACASKKQVTDSATTTTGKADTEKSALKKIVQTVNANRQDEKFLTSKLSLSVQTDDKKVSLGGSLRMKRDEVIQLSLVTFGILEVARIEITPDYLLIIDKVGRQYVKASFSDISFLRSAGVDFRTLQALFWDELFLLTGKTPADNLFTKTADGNNAKLVNAEGTHAVLTFLVDTSAGLLQQTAVSPHASGAKPYLTWQYADFAPLGGKKFPARHRITSGSNSRPFTMTISLSSLRNEGGWETRTELPSQNYTEVPAEKLLSRIINLKR